ncbi:hypothetical protein E0H88_15145 [Acinetobacter sp. ANC 4216]|uniref:hypothetical protein n=1 Tax=Acinetobacter sp. ANC 4216 TaxID=2529840 RepID=UPI0010397563|nr:hypothetical protein [Acinetobacter sp. ANC 4216]TCB64240.1 hypothetical protein E0H88_15145 [Acinetobacter sp. ANC 4216]
MKPQFNADRISEPYFLLFQHLTCIDGKKRRVVILKNCNSNTRKAHILAGIEAKLIDINKAPRILICDVKMIEN